MPERVSRLLTLEAQHRPPGSAASLGAREALYPHPGLHEAAIVETTLKWVLGIDYPCEVELVRVATATPTEAGRCSTPWTTCGRRCSATTATRARAPPSTRPPPIFTAGFGM